MAGRKMKEPERSRPVALITGGTRGIGLGIAESLAREGYDLALCGRRSRRSVESVLRSLAGDGRSIHYVQADVAEKESRIRLLKEVRKRLGRLNVLVNNAGMAPPVRADILESTWESFDTVMRVNLSGPYFLTQQCAAWMIDQKQEDPASDFCIINISSVSATVVSVNRGEYCISKAGLSMATQLWAARLGEYDIPVYEIRPGVTETDMTAGKKVKQKYDRLIAGGLLVEPRWGRPEDMGKAAAMLVRGDLPYSTGQVLVMDGGLTLQRL